MAATTPAAPAAATTARTARWEEGSIATFVVLLVVPMVAMSALAFDGGQILTARRHAADTAQNAALAGAQAVSGPSVRQGGVDLAGGRVVVAAQDYLARNGAVGTVTVGPDEVVVTVTETAELSLLPIVGISSRTVTGTGRAALVRGVDGPETVPGP